MAMYKTSMGRQINQIGNQAKSIKNRNDVRAKLRAEGFKGDVDQELRERTGQPCIICEKKFFWEELTEYGGYYVCDNCRDENAISSIEDIEAIVGPLQ
jgi:DNA-directed RNA polymerase subunit RPC12/RpoP